MKIFDNVSIYGTGGTASSSTAFTVLNSGGTTNFLVRDDGNVGIGITNPPVKLTVRDGDIQVISNSNSSSVNPFYFANQSQNSFIIGRADGIIGINSGLDYDVALQIGNTSNKTFPLRIRNYAGDKIGVFTDSGNFGLSQESPTARLHIKGYDSTSSNYALKIVDSGYTSLFNVRNDGEIDMNGFTIRQLSNYSIFKNSGSNGYLFNNAADNTNLARLTNTGVLILNQVASINSGVQLSVQANSSNDSIKENIAELFKKTTNNTGVLFASKEGVSYMQGTSSANGQAVDLILGGYDGAGNILETLILKNNGKVGIGVFSPTAGIDISGGTGNPFLAQSTINGSGAFGIFRNNDSGFDVGQEIQIDFQQQTSTLSRMSSSYFGGSDFGFNFYGNNGFLNSTPIMTLRGTGNVGIGMTGGTHKLNVNGNIGLSGISNTYNIAGYELLKISQGSGAPNISLGNNNTLVDAGNGGGIAIGSSVLAADDGIAIGLNASASTGTVDAIAIGRSAIVSNGSIRGVAIGREASVIASNAFAIGNYTTASQDDTIILGNNISGNKPKIGIGFSTPSATLDVSGNTSSSLLRLNNSNFSFSNKLLVSNDGSFYAGSINAFGGFGTGTFQTDQLTYTFNTSFSTFLAFSNNGGSGNRTSYGIIGAPLSSADTNYRLTLINNDAGTIGNVLNILSTASSSTNDSFDYYSYGINLVSNGLHINSGSGNYHKIGLNVDVSGADINYAALFNGGNVGIGTSVPDAKLSILTPTSTTALGLNSNSTTDTIVELATNNAAAFRSKIYLEDSTQTLNFYTKNNDTIFWNGNGLAQSKTLTLFTDTSAKFESSVGIGVTATAKLDISGSTGYNQFRMRTSFTPTGTTDGAGNTGDLAWDADYIYIKTGAGWKRSGLATW